MFVKNVPHSTLGKSQTAGFNILRPVLKIYLKSDTVLLGEWLFSFEGMRCVHLQSQAEPKDCLPLEEKNAATLLNVRNYSPNNKQYHKPETLHPKTTECFRLHQNTYKIMAVLCVSAQSLCYALHQAFSDFRGN
jgi:hypothetical protein